MTSFFSRKRWDETAVAGRQSHTEAKSLHPSGGASPEPRSTAPHRCPANGTFSTLFVAGCRARPGFVPLQKATPFRTFRTLSRATKTSTVAQSHGAAFQSCDAKQEGTDFSHFCGLRHTFFLEKHLQNEYYITGGTWGRAGPGRGRADDTDLTQLTQRRAALPAQSAVHLLFRFSLYFSDALHTHAQERQKEEEEEMGKKKHARRIREDEEEEGREREKKK